MRRVLPFGKTPVPRSAIRYVAHSGMKSAWCGLLRLAEHSTVGGAT